MPHDQAQEVVRNALQVVRPLEYSNILRQVLLMRSSESSQEISQACPNTFHCIAVYLPLAISVIISCVFSGRVTHGPMLSSRLANVMVGRRFIRINRGFLPCCFFDFRLNSFLLRIITNSETNLARFSSNDPMDRRAIILHGSDPSTFVGTPTRRIFRVTMFLSLLSSVLKHLVGFSLLVR
jgi:hypothetical protein